MQSSNENEKIEVLIAEDNLMNRMLMNRIVKTYLPLAIISFAKNGQEAVDAFKKPNTNFSLIIMDGLMPIMEGWDAIDKIRKWHTTEGLNKKRPIIISWSTEPRALVYDTDGKTVIGIKAFEGADAALSKQDGTKSAELGELLIKFNFISTLTPTPSEPSTQTSMATPVAPLISQFSSTQPSHKRSIEDTIDKPQPESHQSKPKSK